MKRIMHIDQVRHSTLQPTIHIQMLNVATEARVARELCQTKDAMRKMELLALRTLAIMLTKEPR